MGARPHDVPIGCVPPTQPTYGGRQPRQRDPMHRWRSPVMKARSSVAVNPGTPRNNRVPVVTRKLYRDTHAPAIRMSQGQPALPVNRGAAEGGHPVRISPQQLSGGAPRRLHPRGPRGRDLRGGLRPISAHLRSSSKPAQGPPRSQPCTARLADGGPQSDMGATG